MQSNPSLHQDESTLHIQIEQRARRTALRVWILGGLFFMALPGTLLGFSNLLAVSSAHGHAFIPSAWMEGHGHAQVFGWIGSFILGIGFYSQPHSASIRRSQCTGILWLAAVGMRWLASVYGIAWRFLLPLSALLELIVLLVFLHSSMQHKRTSEPGTQTKHEPLPNWMLAVLLGTLGMMAAVLFNCVECIHLAVLGQQRSFPHALDQRYLVLLGWGILVPMIWGFSARWLPQMAGSRQPCPRGYRIALALFLPGVLCGTCGVFPAAAVLLCLCAIAINLSFRSFQRNAQKASDTVSAFMRLSVRISYLWLTVAGGMSLWAAWYDQHGGIWGASRHALTVGFAASMVFIVGSRVLPAFLGGSLTALRIPVRIAFCILQIGCILRVTSEPIAYEGFANWAWKVLPVSGTFELTAVLLFALALCLALFTKPKPQLTQIASMPHLAI